MDYTQYDFIKQKYNGVLEIYPRKAVNSYVYESILKEISKTHTIHKIFEDYLRAFER